MRLDQVEMTPLELVLTEAVAAGDPLRLRQDRRLRPVVVGFFQITSVSAEGVSQPLALRDVPTFEDITNRWSQYEQSGLLAILDIPADLPAGTKLTVRGRRYDGVDLVRQRYSGRQARVWLERVTDEGPAGHPVSEPLIVRTVPGPIEYLQAYRKADGRVLVQAFDQADNPADSTGQTYTITGDDASLVVPAEPGLALTEITLPASLHSSGAIHVTDTSGRACRSSALPRGIDGRSIFFGDIHFHSGFSDGDFPPEDAIQWARTRIGLDFTGPGDHIGPQGDFDGLTVAHYVQYGRHCQEAGKFCRVPALELAGAPGHQLLLARDFDTFEQVMAAYVRKGAGEGEMDSAAYCHAVSALMVPGKTLIAPTHPLGHPGRWPDIADKSAFGAAEIIRGQASSESSRDEPDYLATGLAGPDDSSIRYALSIGYRLGFLGDSDNHRALPGMPMLTFHGTTAVQSETLDTVSIFDAIRRRRCYATSGARIVADATLNGQPIGSDVPIGATDPRTFNIVVRGTAPIAAVQIIHCGNVLKALAPAEPEHDVTIDWTDTPLGGRQIPPHEYYYIRLRQTDGHCAWLSPFWITPR